MTVTPMTAALLHYEYYRRQGAPPDDALTAAALYLRRKLCGSLDPASAIRAVADALQAKMEGT